MQRSKANFLRSVDKAAAAIPPEEASGLSVYLQECGSGEQAKGGEQKEGEGKSREGGGGRGAREGWVT